MFLLVNCLHGFLTVKLFTQFFYCAFRFLWRRHKISGEESVVVSLRIFNVLQGGLHVHRPSLLTGLYRYFQATV